MTAAEFEESEFMRWQRGNGRVNHHMVASVPIAATGLYGAMSVHRHLDEGPTPSDNVRAFTALLPSITSALNLAFKQSELLVDTHWDGLMRGLGDKAAALLDEYGAVIRLSPAMEKIALKADGLSKRGERIVASDPSSDGRLQAIIHAALGEVPRSDGTRIIRSSGRSPYVVTTHALPRRHRMLAPYEAAALMIVIDPSHTAASNRLLYRRIFELTRKEADVAALLLEGHSPESISNVLGVSLPTVRTHLRHIFEKTDTGRQSDLVRLLQRAGSQM